MESGGSSALVILVDRLEVQPDQQADKQEHFDVHNGIEEIAHF
jgi:hypothetical protein